MKLNNIVYSFSEFASAMAKLHDEKHFDYLVTIIGEDFGEEGLGCIYILENTDTHERISVKTIAEKKGDSDVIWSITSLYKCANLLEREVFDFLGIKFLGHPDMRRLFLRNDFKGYPLRKDFVAQEGYTLEDDEEPNYTMQYSLDKDGNLVEKQVQLFGDDEFVINIGPQHPSTHGVLRLETVLDGETVKRIVPHLGYIHRGIEKMFESMTYPQTLAMTDRLNYLSAMINRHIFSISAVMLRTSVLSLHSFTVCVTVSMCSTAWRRQQVVALSRTTIVLVVFRMISMSTSRRMSRNSVHTSSQSSLST